jgi:hypothetical protein
MYSLLYSSEQNPLIHLITTHVVQRFQRRVAPLCATDLLLIERVFPYVLVLDGDRYSTGMGSSWTVSPVARTR